MKKNPKIHLYRLKRYKTLNSKILTHLVEYRNERVGCYFDVYHSETTPTRHAVNHMHL